jgi:cytochrome b561
MAAKRLEYGATAKVFHWAIVALLLVQYPLGWLMPDIRRDMTPGVAMTVHISLGFTILLLIVLRLFWRLSHPVAPEGSLPAWQRIGSEAVHWLLYLLVFITCVTGWTFANMRGWSVSLFGLVPLPQLFPQGDGIGRSIGLLHQSMTWILLALISVHALAAIMHFAVYRDGVLQRMLPRR